MKAPVVRTALYVLARYVMRCLDEKFALPAPSKRTLREVEELQRRSSIPVTMSPAARLRRKQRVARYMRNQSRFANEMPGHIREKMA